MAYPALDGLRAVAATLVFWVHFAAVMLTLLPNQNLETPHRILTSVGYWGVEVFFVLSGFLIYGAALRSPVEPAQFMKRRIARIFPAFLVVLALYVLLGNIGVSHDKTDLVKDPLVLIANAFLLPGVFDLPIIVTVAWSLSYELFFYAGIAFLMLLGLLRFPRSVRIGGVVTIFVALNIIGSWFPRLQQFTAFLPGILLAEYIKTPMAARGSQGSLIPLVALGLGILVRALIVPSIDLGSHSFLQSTLPSLLLIGLPCAWIIRQIVRGDVALTQLLSASGLVALGRCSYSFYLVHGLALHLAVAIASLARPLLGAGVTTNSLFVLGFGFAGSCALAELMFRVVEVPGIRWASRRT